MIAFLERLKRNERGNVLILTAACLPLLVGSAGLATDTIQWALWKRQLQRAADSAAIAGVYDRVQSNSTSGTLSVVNKDLTINQHTGLNLLGGYPIVTFPGDTGNQKKQVKVELAIRQPLTFSSMFMATAPTIKATATAAGVPGTDDYCVVSLESTNAMGFQGSGNGTLILDCGIITNSVSSNAAAAKGSSGVEATVIAAAGGIQQSNNWKVGKYDPYVPQIEDPYKSVTPNPADMVCAETKQGNNWVPVALTDSTNVAAATDRNGVKANCFSSVSVGANKTLNMPAGTYYINGGGADIKGTLNANAQGGTSFVLTNKSASNTAPIGSWDMNAQGLLNITAPTSGPFAGFAIYQDRRATDSGGSPNNMPASAPNKINGGSGTNSQGVFYFPSQQVTFNGGSGVAAKCAQFIGRRLQFSGNTTVKLTKNCGNVIPPPIKAGVKVRLVA